MPVPGYSGHIRGHRADGWKSFGTTHWKNAGQVTGHKAAASTGWDYRDDTGRPFGGYTPGDGGVQTTDPEFEAHRAEANAANDLLNARSANIRAMQEKSRYVVKPFAGLSW